MLTLLSYLKINSQLDIQQSSYLNVEYFRTESGFDVVFVGPDQNNMREFSGFVGPQGLYVPQGSLMGFTSDGSDRYNGFKICFSSTPLDDDNLFSVEDDDNDACDSASSGTIEITGESSEILSDGGIFECSMADVPAAATNGESFCDPINLAAAFPESDVTCIKGYSKLGSGYDITKTGVTSEAMKKQVYGKTFTITDGVTDTVEINGVHYYVPDEITVYPASTTKTDSSTEIVTSASEYSTSLGAELNIEPSNKAKWATGLSSGVGTTRSNYESFQ
jgi:hypothetical protein